MGEIKLTALTMTYSTSHIASIYEIKGKRPRIRFMEAYERDVDGKLAM